MRFYLSTLLIGVVTLACSQNTAPATETSPAGSAATAPAPASAAPASAAPAAEPMHAAAPPAATPGASAELTKVTPSLVCMINDQFMGREQIPVVVDGRTYYGCCPACKQKLNDSAEARSAIDPVSGRPVDKAQAVIGRKADGSVLYFESAETMARYGRS